MGLLVFYDRLFGGIPAVDEFGSVSVANIAIGAAGLLLDQQYGLLIYAPVYVLALWGLAQLGWLRVPARLGAAARRRDLLRVPGELQLLVWRLEVRRRGCWSSSRRYWRR